jgi:CDP-diacylglycerol--serine O-phosphatidyltransferase
MKKYIPNTVTCLNLFSGCIAVLLILQKNYTGAFYCVLASGIFDFFDGMLARLLHVKSNIGKELDSLADVVSFGFVPGVLMFTLLSQVTDHAYLPYLGFLITVFSALRLAKFNVDTRQATDFIGVNTPMNTFLIISLPFIAEQFPNLIYSVYVLIAITLVSSLLLVSELRLFSMKLSALGWRENKFKYAFLLLSVVLLLFLKILAIPLIFVCYLFFSKLHFAGKISEKS